MKNIMIGGLMMAAATTIYSCTASRSAAGPGGAVTPGYGSAANVSSGRNVEGVAMPSKNPESVPGTATNNSTGGKDSLSNKVDAASDKTAQFLREVAFTNHTVVEASRIIQQNAGNEYVKSFANTLVKDHESSDAALRSLAATKNVSLDSTAIHKDRNDQLKQLTAVTGEELESMYVQMMIKDHEQAVDLYERGEGSGDQQVQAFSKQYLPMIKAHHKRISAFNKK